MTTLTAVEPLAGKTQGASALVADNEDHSSKSQSGSDDTAKIVRQVAHELRQPLSTIESIAFYLDLVLPQGDERVREQVARLRALVDQSNWIVSNAVHFVQASPAVPRELDLEETLRAAAGETHIGSRLRLMLGDRPVFVRIDPAQALHLFQSLITFFSRIVTTQQPLLISACDRSGELCVRLESQATRYSRAEIETMLDPFSGSGLMMASVRRIVEAHRARIEFEAEHRAGTQFTLYLPR